MRRGHTFFFFDEWGHTFLSRTFVQTPHTQSEKWGVFVLCFVFADQKIKKCLVLSVAPTLQPWTQILELAMLNSSVASAPMFLAHPTPSLLSFSSLMYMVPTYTFLSHFTSLIDFCILLFFHFKFWSGCWLFGSLDSFRWLVEEMGFFFFGFIYECWEIFISTFRFPWIYMF